MAVLNDLVKGVVDSVLREILAKVGGTGKRARRRKSTAAAGPKPRTRRTKAATPAKKQTSRKRTIRTRSKVKQRSA